VSNRFVERVAMTPVLSLAAQLRAFGAPASISPYLPNADLLTGQAVTGPEWPIATASSRVTVYVTYQAGTTAGTYRARLRPTWKTGTASFVPVSVASGSAQPQSIELPEQQAGAGPLAVTFDLSVPSGATGLAFTVEELGSSGSSIQIGLSVG